MADFRCHFTIRFEKDLRLRLPARSIKLPWVKTGSPALTPL
jgi:hypothetical protein